MKTSISQWLLAAAAALLIGACATVPPGPPPDVARLQSDLDRLHADPRTANNSGPELVNADAAVDMLARNARTLDPREYQQGVYIAGKLVAIAEASALARYAEERGVELGVERQRLVAQSEIIDTRTRVVTVPVPARDVRTGSGELVPQARAELMAMQDQLPGVESRLDARGLVIRLGDYMFEPGRAVLTPSAEQSLDAVARVLRNDADAGIVIEGYGETAMATERANAVRDYLDARDVDVRRIAARTVAPYGARGTLAENDRRVDIVIRSDLH